MYDREYDISPDVAQICLNGHVINSHAMKDAEFNRDYCEECGAKTIVTCPSCEKHIIGEGKTSYGGYDNAPNFCAHCGKPYPWIASRIHAAKAMADELSELNDADRILLKASIDDIAANTPMTEVAVVRAKKLIAKVGKESAGSIRRLIVDVAGKAAAELLKGAP